MAGTALSETLRTPVLVPLAVGLKVTLMLQELPAARTVPQVCVWEKSPLMVMLLMVSVAVPVFLRVTV